VRNKTNLRTFLVGMAVVIVAPPPCALPAPGAHTQLRHRGSPRRVSAAPAPAARAPGPLDRLKVLAAAAQKKRGWAVLRAFAASVSDPQLRAQAYFALGYQEYVAADYSHAAGDFQLAENVESVISDYADYYQAQALYQSQQAQSAVEHLDGFSARHPKSVLRTDALELLANAALRAGVPEKAVETLRAEPETRHSTSLLLLLAQVERRAGNLEDAAKDYQAIYYGHPASTQAKAAKEGLAELRARLGAEMPAVSLELAVIQARAFVEHGEYNDALKEYTALLKQSTNGSVEAQCRIGLARALLRLKRTGEAIDRLTESVPSNRDVDAERLATLVEAYAQSDNRAAIDSTLSQLSADYSSSPSYAEALSTAGSHLVRQGDWKTAAQLYYGPVAELFPETQLGEEANWRVAWSYYLQKDTARAREAFRDNATRYPDSQHVTADFYWLGRLAEQEGDQAEAARFFALVVSRWAQTYYALAAKGRMSGLKSGPSVAQADDPASLADELAKKVPPPPAPLDLCEAVQNDPALRPYVALRFLDLNDLAEGYLRLLVREEQGSPGALIALSRMEKDQGDYNPSVVEASRAVPTYADANFSDLPGEIWSLLYPTAYWKVVDSQAKRRHIDAFLVMGLIRQESAFNPRAVSPAHAFGLMQILVPTARTRKGGRRANARRLYDPMYNVKLGTDYLQHLLELNSGVFEQAMAAYHAGEERVSAWRSEYPLNDPAEFLESIPIPATRIYVEKVIRDAAIYRKLLTGTPVFKKCQ